MATEVEIKAKERKEILDEIKRKRAAAAQSEGILGAAERGEYGDVGQGGEKGPFDDEVNQDPGNEDVTKSSMVSKLPEYGMYGTMGPFQEMIEKGVGDETLGSRMVGTLTKGKLFEPPSSGFGSEYAADNIPIIKDMDPLSKAVYNTVAPYGEKAFDIIDTVYRMFGATAADIAQVAGVDEKDVNEIQAAVNTTIGMLIPQGNPVMTTAATSQALKNVSNAVNEVKNTSKFIPEIFSGEYSIFGSPPLRAVGADIVDTSIPRQIKVASGSEPDLTKLIIKKNGKDFVNIGSATNNRLIELDKVKLVKKQLSESDRNPRDQYFFQLKSKDDDLRLTKDEPGTFVTVSNRKIPIEDTTRIDLDVPYGNRQTFYRVINEDKKLIRERNDNDAKFIKYYQNNLTDKKRSLADIGGDSEFRFFNNIRRTEPDLEADPNAFFSQYNKKRIQPGGDLHEKYLQFEKIDQIRKTNIEELRPVLIKILSNLTGKDSKAHFQIAHKYMASGIKKGFVDKSKKGTGADAAELYIDISDYNAGIQKTLEANARMIIKQGLADGKSLDEIKNMRDFKLLDLDMKNLGIQGEANGLTIGKAIPIDEKIGNLIIRGLNKGIISDAESKIAEEAVDRILNVKKEFEIIFQQPAPFAKGGLVGINYLTRPLGNF